MREALTWLYTLRGIPSRSWGTEAGLEGAGEPANRAHDATGSARETALAYAPAEPFDGVLRDAPCSATGTFRRHPAVVWHRDPAEILFRARLAGHREFRGGAERR